MRDGFIQVASGSIDITIADPAQNAERIIACVRRADAQGAHLLALPELCVTGYTCHDLFLSDTLLDDAEAALLRIRDATCSLRIVAAVGVPIRCAGKLFNCAAIVHRGEILAFVPKTHLPNYGEFYEARIFTGAAALSGVRTISFGGRDVPIGTGIVFRNADAPECAFGVELCEDLWAADPPSRALAEAGALVILNLSASNEGIGKAEYRRLLVESTSARLLCGYVYANASPGESTQDLVFSRHSLIGENGVLLAENKPFEENDLLTTEIDVQRLAYERRRVAGFAAQTAAFEVPFHQSMRETPITRRIDRNPFVPPADDQLRERAERILQMQSYGLKKRVEHSRAKRCVVGISGGLDSCLALLVAARCMDVCGRSRKDVLAITMPGFGTTGRTKTNAALLCQYLGVTLREIGISDSVRQHFRDIGHDESVQDVTYENSQARERTQVLMDVANEVGGLVVGTGDLSELALGWATYNGDHMSMYGVNASIPKTLVRYVVRYEAERSDENLRRVLFDILDTPVSPELLPPDESGAIAQKTEDVVGPYELHDFYLYYLIRMGFRPRKVYRLAKIAFTGEFDNETILRWLRVFIRRFFQQQFKRSCLPDGPKVGSASLSPRGDWRMPSDASAQAWLREMESLEQQQKDGKEVNP